MRSRTKISIPAFVSPLTRFVAREAKATKRPSSLTAGSWLFPPAAWASALSMLTRSVVPAVAIADEYVDEPVGISGYEVGGEGLERDDTAIGVNGGEVDLPMGPPISLDFGAVHTHALRRAGHKVANEHVHEAIRVTGHEESGA